MPDPWDPTKGLIPWVSSGKPTVVETRARGRHVVYIRDVGFRYVTTRGCSDYADEFSSHTNFPRGPVPPNNAEEMEEPAGPEFIDCPNPFEAYDPGSHGPFIPPDYGVPGYDPRNPGPIINPPQGPGEQE